MTVPWFDTAILGAGAAGLFCAGMAGQAGAKVLLIDHAEKVAEKIRISGGGRCNFTNRDTAPDNFLSSNPRFCRSALAGYSAADFLGLVQRHRIAWHEKHKGQLFCDESADDIIGMLLRECDKGSVTRWQPCGVAGIEHATAHDPSPEGPRPAALHRFTVLTDRGPVSCGNVVIATGGLSIPKIGATDFGYRMARQFGHQVVQTRPALVPLTFDPVQWAPFTGLAGLSVTVGISTGERGERGSFVEDLLFTHRGLSGPAVLQISSYWHPGAEIRIDLAPGRDLEAELLAAKRSSRRLLSNELALMLPSRLAETWLASRQDIAQRAIAELPDKALRDLAASLQAWSCKPANSEGYRKAEVTAGGVDTRELSSRTMESKLCPGLYFIGEIIDVTGWLGGYNFQWAWSSAAACARALADSSPDTKRGL